MKCDIIQRDHGSYPYVPASSGLCSPGFPDRLRRHRRDL